MQRLGFEGLGLRVRVCGNGSGRTDVNEGRFVEP